MGVLEKYPRPSVAVDIVVFTIFNSELKVLLIKRGLEPFKDFYCLPGGFIKMQETLEQAALRELEEEVGVKNIYLEQLYTFGEPKRDPRGRVISVCYYVLLDYTKIRPFVTGEENIRKVEWHSTKNLPKLAFDHNKIIDYALKRLRYKLEYSSVGLELLPDKFTLTELQSLYEIILNEKIDKRNFRKKILAMGILQPTRDIKQGQHRPAKMYSFIKSNPNSAFKKTKFEG